MSKIILSNVGSLIDATTAAATINLNSSIIQGAMDNTLSRDGTAPNQMQAPLDMNSRPILNLPAPVSNFSPLRLQDLEDFLGTGTITTIPSGGAINSVLTKNSGLDYDVSWKATTNGSAGQVQYNAGGVMAGITGSSTNGTTLTLASPVFTGTTTAAALSVSSTAVLVSRRTSIAGGNPTTSGIASGDVNQFIIAGNSNVDTRFGLYSNGDVWLQPSSSNNYAFNFNLILNPNGGNVGIGTSSSPSSALTVNGNVTFTSNAFVVNGTTHGTGERLGTFYDANMVTGDQVFVAVGQADSTFNRTSFAFHYTGNSNSDNFGWVGLFAQDQTIKWDGQGFVGIGRGTTHLAHMFEVGSSAQFTVDGSGNALAAGSIGYQTGVGTGGAVTQTTSRLTGVTLNKISGAITLLTAAATVGAYATFTVTNSTVSVGDTVVLSQQTGSNTYSLFVSKVSNGSFNITFASVAGTASEAPIFNFNVIKGSSN